MIGSLDSSFDAPTLEQARAAKAAGVGFWWGYLATQQTAGAFNLAAPWSRGAFANVQDAGLGCGAFVSGWDDPVALRQLAQAWGIPLLALDDEDGIRPLTTPDWRPEFLTAAGAGLYGLLERQTIAARFRIAALYPVGGCTGATWPTSPAPPEPHGWQCQGTHTELGLSVDRSALDDWFGGQTMLDPTDPTVQRWDERLADIDSMLADYVRLGAAYAADGTPTYTQEPGWPFGLKAAILALQQPPVDAGQVASALAANATFLDALSTAVAHKLGGALDKA